MRKIYSLTNSMLKLQRPVKWKVTTDYRVTQWFWNDYYVNWRLVYWSMWYPWHMWIDYAGRSPWMKIPLYATADGWCYITNSANGYGNHIKFYFTQDWQNYRCVYGHLDSFSVSHKQFVKKWEQIGVMGTTWFSSWVHLHFDVVRCTDTRGIIDTKDGYKWFFDPAPYIVDREEDQSKFTEEQIWWLQTALRLNSRLRDKISDTELRNKRAELNELIRSKIA